MPSKPVTYVHRDGREVRYSAPHPSLEKSAAWKRKGATPKQQKNEDGGDGAGSPDPAA